MCFFECYGYHRDLHVRTHSFPTRRSSDLLALFSGDAWRIGGEGFANVLHLDDACIRDRLVRTVEPPALHRAAGVACGIEPVGDAGILRRNDGAETSILVHARLCVVQAAMIIYPVRRFVKITREGKDTI